VVIPIVLYKFMVVSREFHLAQRARLMAHPVGSWVAFVPNGMGDASKLNPTGLGAMLPSPHRISTKYS